jgi:two-component system CheB/CheR fusion protein
MSDSDRNRPLKILVVENHEDTLRWLTLYLEELGHTVAGARTLAEARAALATGEHEVLLSDIGLPDGTGWDLLESEPLSGRIFAIAMSGFGQNANNARSRAAGYRHHLIKPFKLSELERVLAEAAQQGAR